MTDAEAQPTGVHRLDGTRWHGESRLWLQPGAEAAVSDATAWFDGADLHYTWSLEGQEHRGTITVAEDRSARWTDTFHQKTTMDCHPVEGPGALLSVLGAYDPPDSDWHWRTLLSVRPSGELVLQMTNVTSWGEEAPAVQMVFVRD